jgi:hypothetical protein
MPVAKTARPPHAGAVAHPADVVHAPLGPIDCPGCAAVFLASGVRVCDHTCQPAASYHLRMNPSQGVRKEGGVLASPMQARKKGNSRSSQRPFPSGSRKWSHPATLHTMCFSQ